MFTSTAGDSAADTSFLTDINALLAEYVETMDAVKLRAGLHLVMQISARGNQYLQETEYFKLFDTNPALCAKITSRAINLIYALSAVVHPFMPSTSSQMLEQLNAPARVVPEKLSNDLLAGHTLGKPDYLFKRIEEKQAEIWRKQFGGQKKEEAEVAAPVSKRAAAKAAKSKQAAAAPAYTGPKTPEMIELESKITKQGDVVRRIKGGKAEEGDGSVDDAIAMLKKLKIDLEELTTDAAAAATTAAVHQ